ncbi:MAG: PEP-utilizing enzyme [Acidimicrobiia bacterium]|nr:PEP-utilizing enzyme [Acidimicrobiia bacterium]
MNLTYPTSVAPRTTAGVPTTGKAGRLIAAAAAGLPVPALLVVPDGQPAPSLGELRRWADDAVRSPASTNGTGARLADAPTIVAVRSAFSAEDHEDSSLAGWFRTELRVPLDEVPAAIERVRASAADRTDGLSGGELRRDVMVMAMVDAARSGVAFSEPGTYDDIVNVVGGTAERLVGGEERGETVHLARLEQEPAGWRRRLQALLDRVRRHAGDRPWDIEWADDGTTCWLIQLRPITAPTRRNETFTIANHAEILPPLPSHLMTSVIERAGDELFGWYRRFDSSLPDNRPFLEVIAGRPFINLTLLEDLLRHLGLPTRLVADSIGGPPSKDRSADLARLVKKLPVLTGLGLAQVVAVVRAERNQRRLATAGDGPAATFGEALDQLHEAYVGLVTGMFPLSSAIGPPLALLRRAGTLADHAGRHRTITAELAEALDEVRHGAMAVDEFLTRFGHRGVYESDIARPRFADAPELLGDLSARASATVGSTAEVSDPDGDNGAGDSRNRRRRIRTAVTWPVWAAARKPLAAREALRDRAMIGFATIRRSLVSLAEQAVERQQLRSVDDLWLLTVDEALAVDDGWVPEPAFWAARAKERTELAALDPPPIVRRFDDPATWRHDAPSGRRLSGLPLTGGTVRGRAWVLREPSVDLPDGFDPATTVLIARSVDAGWIPTFTRVAAVVVETGGDLSHGSILLRERGVPSVTNVSGVTRFVGTGDDVEVRVGAGVIEKLDPNRAAGTAERPRGDKGDSNG